jgi:hypothetical protein
MTGEEAGGGGGGGGGAPEARGVRFDNCFLSTGGGFSGRWSPECKAIALAAEGTSPIASRGVSGATVEEEDLWVQARRLPRGWPEPLDDIERNFSLTAFAARWWFCHFAFVIDATTILTAKHHSSTASGPGARTSKDPGLGRPVLPSKIKFSEKKTPSSNVPFFFGVLLMIDVAPPRRMHPFSFLRLMSSKYLQ